MTRKAPGKYYRKGISLWPPWSGLALNEKAEEWLTQCRWPDGPGAAPTAIATP